MARKNKKRTTKPSITPATDPNKRAVEILPYLYLGPHTSTAKASILALGITHVISVGARPKGGHASVSYHRLSLADEITADITKPALLAAEIITAAHKSRPDAKILVHCVAAVSRSPAIIASYLVREEGMSLRDAIAALVKARSAVRPNDGFLKQLKVIEMEVRGGSSLDLETLPLATEERMRVLGLSNSG